MERAAIHLGVGLPPRLVDLRAFTVPPDVDVTSMGLTARRFARTGLEDALQLCERIGISEQQCLLESEATASALAAAIADVAGRLDPNGLVVASFAGHGRQMPEPDPANPSHDAGWVLFDRVIPEPELVRMFDALPSGATVVLIDDHCFGLGPPSRPAAIARSLSRPPKLMSISAVDETNRRTLTGTTLVSLIEQAMFIPDACPTNRELERRLTAQPQLDPKVWCSEPQLWNRPPFV
jgi:hypothetical protein